MKNQDSKKQKKHMRPTRGRTKREKIKADYEAFLSAAGSWSGLVDTDKLIADIYESRRLSSGHSLDLDQG